MDKAGFKRPEGAVREFSKFSQFLGTKA